MSNLGNYQRMTTIASKVGGPVSLFLIIVISSAVLAVGAFVGFGEFFPGDSGTAAVTVEKVGADSGTENRESE